jgi:hypothetical protein
MVGTVFSVSQLNHLNVSKHFYTQMRYVGWQQQYLSFAQQNVPRNVQKFGIPALYNSSIFIRYK